MSFVFLVPDQDWGFTWLVNIRDETIRNQYRAISRGIIGTVLGEDLPGLPAEGLLRRHGKLLVSGMLLLQIMVLGIYVWLLLRWRRNLTRRPRGRSWLALYLLMPVVLDVGLVLTVTVFLPRQFDVPLLVLWRSIPDAGLVSIVITVLALLGGATRTGLGVLYGRPRIAS